MPLCAHAYQGEKYDEVKLWRRIKHTAYFNKFFSFLPRAEWHLDRFSAHAWSKVKVGLSHTWNCCHESYDPDCSEVLFSFYMPLSVPTCPCRYLGMSETTLKQLPVRTPHLFSVPLYEKDMLYLKRRRSNKPFLLLSLDFKIVNANFLCLLINATRRIIWCKIYILNLSLHFCTVNTSSLK